MDLLWALVNSYGYGSNSLSALWIVLVIVLALIVVLVSCVLCPWACGSPRWPPGYT